METTFRVSQDERRMAVYDCPHKAVRFANKKNPPKHSTIYVDVMHNGRREPFATLATKEHNKEIKLAEDFEIHTSKTVKSYDGKQNVNIKAHQESLKVWPLRFTGYINDDGKAGLMDAVYSTYECGCKIIGNGSLQFPISIKFCDKHK